MNTLPVLVRKEIRALAPLALTSAAVVLACGIGTSLLPDATADVLRVVGLIVYVSGSLGAGAALIGLELQHGTLGVLLAQPPSRARLYAAKLLAGGLALGALWAAAALIQRPSGIESAATAAALDAGGLLLVTSLFVAPWLTMLTRSALAGVVATMASPLAIAFVLSFVGLFDRNLVTVVGWSMVTFAAIAAVAGWRLFTERLEDLAGTGGQIHFRLRRGDAGGVHRDGPPAPLARLRQLAGKETRLQQLPLTLAACYAFASLAAWGTSGVIPAEIDPRTAHMTWLFGCATALLIGAIASAEERQMGTMPYQVIVPMAGWQQFLAKTLMAVALSAVVTLALPAALMPTLAVESAWGPFEWEWYTLATGGLTLAGLYVSSLSTTSLRAFVVAPLLIALAAGVTALAYVVSHPLGLFIYDATYPLIVGGSWGGSARVTLREAQQQVGLPMLIVLAAGLVVMLWRYALANHVRAEDPARRARRQAIVVGVYVALAALTIGSAVSALGVGPTPRSAISGVVLDEAGQPVSGVSVHALASFYVAGRRGLSPRGISYTDSRGRFHLRGLAAGEYFAAAVTYSPFYAFQRDGFVPSLYPGTTDASAAEPIAVNGRGEVGNLTLTLRSGVTAPLAGRVVDERGQPVERAEVYFVADAPGDRVLMLYPKSVRSGPDGAFRFDRVPAGEYIVQVTGPRSGGQTGPVPSGWQCVALGPGGRTDLVVSIGPGGTLSGRIVFEGDSPRPPALQVFVTMRPMQIAPGSARSNRANDNWTFEVGHVSGRQIVRAFVGGPLAASARTIWAMKEVRLGGQDVTNTSLDFGSSGVIRGVEVVLTDRTGTIAGVATDRGKAPSANLNVLVFPADPARWAFPSKWLQRVRTDLSGRFSTPALLPGDYLVVALPSGIDTDWEDPARLARLRPHASAVPVSIGSKRDVTLDAVR